MTQELKAYDIQAELRSEFGVEIGKLGCVMLDVEPLDSASVIPEDWAHVSPDPGRAWIKGIITGVQHVTLLFGLLKNGNVLRPLVDKVLEGWQPPEWVEIEEVGFFASPYEDEAYDCIVAHLKLTPELLEAHTRLELIPHINTFQGYHPHVTLAYVEHEHRDEAVKRLSGLAESSGGFQPLGINYGDLNR